MIVKTQFKTDIVERYKNRESSHKIGRNEGCSYNAVLRELKRRGVDTGVRFWNNREIEKLREFYPINSREELLREFPARTMEAIGEMAKKLRLKKKECRIICRGCGQEFVLKSRKRRNYKEGICLKCVKKQWEHDNIENGRKRKGQWIKRNPGYMSQYYKQLRRKNPKYRLNCNMGVLIYHSLKDKKGGRRWETMVNYTREELMRHLEGQFDVKMSWDNYGSYWHIDHIKPRSLFKYTFPSDKGFKECWALKNLQPLERITNIRKGNTYTTS